MSHGPKIEAQAIAITERVDVGAVGFDPATILLIITQVLPFLIRCFTSTESPDIHESTTILRRMHERHPQALLERTMHGVRAHADEPMKKRQALILAQAIIDQSLSMDTVTAMGCCNEVTA